MKRTYIFLTALALAGCVKEGAPAQMQEQETSGYTIEVISRPAPAARTTLVDNGETYSVNWTSSDVISVNGQESIALVVDATNAKKAKFTFAEEVSTPYYSVYPASAYKAASLADGTATVVIPAEQAYVEGNFDPSAAIMLGYSEVAGSLAFEHAVSYMQIKVTTANGVAVKSVSIKGNEGETMSGEFTAAFADASLVNDSKDGSVVTATCADGFASGKEVIVAIPSRNYTSGVSVTLTDVNGHSRLLKATGSFNAVKGVVYTTEMELKPKGILNVEDYKAFAKAVNDGDYSAFVGEDGDVNLLADITLESGNFEYVNAKWSGIFDGNGHTLTSPSRTLPLFAEIGAQGVVKNLKTAGTFTSFANTSYCGASSFAKINYGLIDGCTNSVNAEYTFTASDATGLAVGCFVGVNAGEIRDCTNNANVKITAKLYTEGSNLIVGGFAAVGHNISEGSVGNKAVGVTVPTSPLPGRFIRCVNKGSISATVTAGKAYVSTVGGICGLVSQDGVVFNQCVNNGAISRISNGESVSEGSASLGGILGRSARTFSATSNWDCLFNTVGYNTQLTNCTNTGDLVHSVRYTSSVIISGADDSKANRETAAGGIVGIIIGTSDSKAKVTSCSNTGKVYGGWSGQSPVIGGIAGYAKYTVCDSNVMTGLLANYSTSVHVRFAGGIVGLAYEGVEIKNGSSKASYNCVASGTTNDLCVGLCVACSIGNVTIKDVTIGVGATANITSKGVASTITKSNYKVYNELVSTAATGNNTNYATTVTNVTWED